MGYQIIERQLKSFVSVLPIPPVKKKVKTPAAQAATRPVDPLTELLTRVAARPGVGCSAIEEVKVAEAFRSRITGLEFSLSGLSAAEESCLAAMTADDWHALQDAIAAKGGAGIAYVEVDAALLPKIAKGLEGLPNLECVSVWAPEHGGKMDFGNLKGRTEPLRINILGTPAKALEITKLKDAKVQASASNDALTASLVFTRDEMGVVDPEPLPLALPRPPVTRVQHLPCVADPHLRKELEGLLKDIAPNPSEVVTVILSCGRFDNDDEFGFDFSKLTPQQVRCVEALPAQAWTAMELSAEKSGEDIAWLTLDNRFDLSPQVAEAMSELPITRLTAPDVELRTELKEMLKAIARLPKFANDPFEPAAVLQAFLDCVRPDDKGEFGLDLNTLTEQQVRVVQCLPIDAWHKLQRSEQGFDKHLRWLDLHEAFAITATAVTSFVQLPALARLTVWAPRRGIFIGLGQLRNAAGELKLKEVAVHPREGKKFAISVPQPDPYADEREDDVSVVLAPGVPEDLDTTKSSKVYYVGKSGLTVAERMFNEPDKKLLQAPEMPCVGDSRLRETLVTMLHGNAEVVQAFLDCGSFNAEGKYGFDLGKLSPEQMAIVQGLPVDAWDKLHRSAKRFGSEIEWLDLHEGFMLSDAVAASRKLCPLWAVMEKLPCVSKLTVSAPKLGIFIGLATLHASAKLAQVAIRPRADKAFVVSIPKRDASGKDIDVVLVQGSELGEELQGKSKVWYVTQGKTTHQRGLNDTEIVPYGSPAPATNATPTKV